ncbi:MAG: hypothetical protein WAO55_10820 [Candidatus Manganitrophaceae bacterium]
MSKRVQRFLAASGFLLCIVGLMRVYALFRARTDDPFFAPHLMVTLLSVWIATSILRVGLGKKEITPRAALSLIRSGSILLMIWSYRLYLVSKSMRTPIDLRAHFYLAFFYMVLGTFVMLLGLKTSRSLRRKAAEAVALEPIPLGLLSKDPAEK